MHGMVGKLALLKKLKQSAEVQDLASVMNDENADTEMVGEAGCKLFIMIYGGKKNDSLTNLHYVKYMQNNGDSFQKDRTTQTPTCYKSCFFSWPAGSFTNNGILNKLTCYSVGLESRKHFTTPIFDRL